MRLLMDRFQEDQHSAKQEISIFLLSSNHVSILPTIHPDLHPPSLTADLFTDILVLAYK